MKSIMLAALAGTALFAATGNASDAPPSPGARSDASRLVCQYVTKATCTRYGNHQRRCTWRRVPVSCTGIPDTGKK